YADRRHEFRHRTPLRLRVQRQGVVSRLRQAGSREVAVDDQAPAAAAPAAAPPSSRFQITRTSQKANTWTGIDQSSGRSMRVLRLSQPTGRMVPTTVSPWNTEKLLPKAEVRCKE